MGEKTAGPPGPCRLCGAWSFLGDEQGAVHPCCWAWREVIAAGRPCPACQIARMVIRTGRLPRNPQPLPAELPDGAPYIPRH